MYWYPNRPVLIPRTAQEFGQFSESSDWTAEVKKNGSRLVLQKDETGAWRFMNRHHSVMTYTPSPSVLDELNSLDIPPDSQLDGELMHTRTKGVKHRIYFYDVYVLGGKKQRGILEKRRETLCDLIPLGLSHVMRSAVYEDDFEGLFDLILESDVDEDEGLVLKKSSGKLKFNAVKSVDVPWQVKVRRPHKNYQF